MTCCATGIERPSDIAASLREDELLAGSLNLGGGRMRTEFVVPAMHCAACIRKIEQGLGKLPFVTGVRANLSQKRVAVDWNSDRGSASGLDRRLREIGYEHSLFDPEKLDAAGAETSKHLLLCLAVAGFAAANIMLLSVSVWSGADGETGQLFHLLSGLIAAPAVFFAGRPFFRSAIAALKGGSLNMDVPISLAVLLAFAMSLVEALRGGHEVYFDAAVMLLFFLLIGRYLDHMMRDRARGAVMRLARLAPRRASELLPDGELRYVSVGDIVPGMILRVAPGERLPVDGIVVTGTSDMDRSLVTGESAPVAVAAGEEVEAGVLNVSGSLDIRALRDARHSFLAEVMDMMAVAEKGRGKYVRVADRMAAIYAPAVHLLALSAFIGWMFTTGGEWHQSLYVAISVLIVTCPCALGLAVPVVHVIGASRLFDAGILMKDGSALERLAEADLAVFDKTGTLTTGSPVVARAEFPDSRSAAIARSLAMHSGHPASLALRDYLVEAVIDPDELSEVPGFGVEACFGGTAARLGRAAWVGEIAATAPAETGGLAFSLEGGEPVSIELAETLRPEARSAVSELHELHIPVEILSGDGRAQVEAIAADLDIRVWHSGLIPSEKLDRVERLKSEGRHVLMVGDGLNDAPALAAGHVSAAPASASDAGRQIADFVFTRNSLAAVPQAVRLARRAANLVRQNFALAIAYNCIAVPLAVAGLVTPLLAAVAMSASSILVVANSMRLNLGGNSAKAAKPGRTGAEKRIAGAPT